MGGKERKEAGEESGEGRGGMNHIFVFVLLIQLSVVMPTHMDAFNG